MTKIEYELVDVTKTQDVVDFTRRQNGQSWAGLLDIEKYVIREQTIASCDVARDELLVYVLENTTTKERVASCEIMLRNAVVYRNESGKVVKADCRNGSIGGVYTYKEFRKQGLAKIMIEKLVQLCQTKLVPGGFLTLHSEVGEYYSRFGFISDEVPVIDIEFKKPVLEFEGPSCSVEEGVLEFKGFREFDELMLIYQTDVFNEVNDNVKQDGITRVAIYPVPEILDWYHTRAKFFYNHFYNCVKVNNYQDYGEVCEKLKPIGQKYFGISLVKDGATAGFIVWTYDYAPEGLCVKVLIVHVRPEYDQSLRFRLLDFLNDYIVAENETLKNKFEKIQVWASEFPGLDYSQLGKVKSNFSLSAIRMCEEDEQKKLEEGQIKWEINNKLPWF